MHDPAQELLLEYLQPSSEDRILILEGGGGWLARKAAELTPQGEVLTLAKDVREVKAAQEFLASTPNATATEDVFPTTGGWDYVLLTMPKGRRYIRTLLLAAWQALKPGGQLLVCGPTKQGAKAMITDAKRLFGNAMVLGYRNRQRVAACGRGEQLPTPLPREFQQVGIAPGTRHEFSIFRPEGKLTFETHPGIFSWDALDEGTALLLENVAIEPDSRVWDVGCGYGVIGLTAAQAGAGAVLLSDINLIGIDYTQTNTRTNNLSEKVKVSAADTLALSPAAPFDLIVSNPAFHQGQSVDKSMADNLISQAPQYLANNGRLVVVANRFLNYDQFMQKYFRQVRRIAETNKFHVIEASG
jgi:16S rRNA (guanine1207-N2)-methyltransferase